MWYGETALYCFICFLFPLLCSAQVRHTSLSGGLADDFGMGVSTFEEWGFVCCSSFPSGSFLHMHVFIIPGGVAFRVVIQEQPVLTLVTNNREIASLASRLVHAAFRHQAHNSLWYFWKQKQLWNKGERMKTLLWSWIFFLPDILVLWEATNLCNSLLVVQSLSFTAMMHQNSKHLW